MDTIVFPLNLSTKLWITLTACTFFFSACGGGGGVSEESDGGSTNNLASVPASQPWELNVFERDSVFESRCVSPRENVTNPLTNNLYVDIQGVELDEKNWLRAWNNNVYLWYDEVTDSDPSLYGGSPIGYFSTLKTQATTASGKLKDEFHFALPTAQYLAESQSGVVFGYGMTLSIIARFAPREIVVAYTQPNSPAINPSVDLKRGEKILRVDGIDLVNTNNSADVDAINNALFPKSNGETHTFTVQAVGSTQTRNITMTSTEVTLQAVQNVKVIVTETGNVGYLLFNEHIASSEQQLIEAITQFKAENVTDVVLDLRYNGGGLIYIASQLASMITDTNTTNDKAFGRPQYNDKYVTTDPFEGEPIEDIPFYDERTTGNGLLPHLGLSRVFVLTGTGTCSASELIMNGLRGVDVEVIQIGATTCGKPYAFRPTDNCSTAYFTVNFKNTNEKGFGDYSDGFSAENDSQSLGIKLPGCVVDDDYRHPLGDIEEKRLAAALYYRNNDQSADKCPVQALRSDSNKGKRFQEIITVKPVWMQNAIE